MSNPTIVVSEHAGFHNRDLRRAKKRLEQGKGYKNLATVCVIPTRGKIDARVVETWWSLMSPMNQPFIRMMVKGMEVGDAYNAAIDIILQHPALNTYPYVLTLEEDNLPPPDGLLKLLESIGEYDAVGGLYWTKGEGGQPMIYGDPKAVLGFQPQQVRINTVQECNGLGMGFTLFKTDVFRKIDKPWFKTMQEWEPDKGGSAYTQDLYFFERARKAGCRVACDTRVRVGHYDSEGDVVW